MTRGLGFTLSTAPNSTEEKVKLIYFVAALTKKIWTNQLFSSASISPKKTLEPASMQCRLPSVREFGPTGSIINPLGQLIH